MQNWVTVCESYSIGMILLCLPGLLGHVFSVCHPECNEILRCTQDDKGMALT